MCRLAWRHPSPTGERMRVATHCLFARSGRTYEAATLGDDVLDTGPMRIGIFIAC